MVLGDIYRDIRLAKEGDRSVEIVVNKQSPEIQKRLNRVVLSVMRDHADLEPNEIRQEIIDCLNRVINHERDARVHSNAKAIAEAYAKGDKEAAQKLLKTLEHDMVQLNKGEDESR